MARRSDHSKEEIKALAIKHAYELIEEKGEAGFKAREIAKRMGYTVGTLYYTFDNMEILRFHVCGQILDTFYNITLKELPKKKNKLIYLITQYIRFSQDCRNQWMFLHSFKGTFKEAVPVWYLEKAQRAFALYAEAFSPYIKNKKTALKAAQVIISSIHGMCILSLNDKMTKSTQLQPEVMAKHLVKTYLKGLNKN
ncbi:MAG: hypothetical protein COA71_13675 [SAR86 cluster bacterium]|uniref:HTH tetR-type domain-containing protein n=1 Tax=SAR86 cluster bacterium TaxID=2030880 RepID=A0A2A5C6V9_9GAMM|nr:TetR/AcrR family transcriptional regulator [Gammaproteobacteria bacterium AH-315-E17]PCJ39503.1 MAG: hypothetical protein COA71_13675 [SAR86 cluster bacterium]